MGWFDAFRVGGGPTQYPSNKTPVTVDVLEMGFYYAIAIITFSLLVVLPGIRGADKCYNTLRWGVRLFVLLSIFLCNFGQEWEVAELHTKTAYRAGTGKEIEAFVGVKIGLRSVNITLVGDPITQKISVYENETVNYNERFSWNNEGWTQGRLGFGPFAGLFNQQFRDAQRKGLPYPILWVAEYFTLDGEGIRWGRHYRQAGYYTHICIWSAFPLWVLSAILYSMLLSYGSFLSMLTGICLLTGNILYATIRNANELTIPFEDGKLEFHWGWCFWLCLVNGLLTFLMGALTFLLSMQYPSSINRFCAHDIADDFEVVYATREELEARGLTVDNKSSTPESLGQVQANGGPAHAAATNDMDEDEEIYANPKSIERGFRKRTTRKLPALKKPKAAPRHHKPALAPSHVELGIINGGEDEDVYENVDSTPQGV